MHELATRTMPPPPATSLPQLTPHLPIISTIHPCPTCCNTRFVAGKVLVSNYPDLPVGTLLGGFLQFSTVLAIPKKYLTSTLIWKLEGG